MGALTQRKQRWLGGAASVAVHLAAIAALAIGANSALPPAKPPIPTLYIDIEPRPLLDGEKPRIIAPAQATAAPQATKRDRATASSAQTAPDQPQPRLAQGVNPDTPDENTSEWQVAHFGQDEANSRRIGQSLRTSVIGCHYPERLTQQERDICDDREGERTARALEQFPRITGTGNARRDARFEAEGRRRMQSFEDRRRPPPDSQRGNTGPEEGPGSNLGIGAAGRHLDPSMRPDSTDLIQTKRDGPPEHRIRRTPH